MTACPASFRRRVTLVALTVALGAVSLTGPRSVLATPNPPTSITVGIGGAGPSSATFSGSGLTGQGDNGLGAPLPTCQAPGCDQFSLTFAAPSGYTTTHSSILTVHVDYTDAAAGSLDIYLVDSNGNTVAAQTSSGPPSVEFSAPDLAPGTYTLEMAGGPAFNETYNGTITTSSALLGTGPVRVAPPGTLSFGRETIADPTHLGTEPTLAVSPDGTVYESPIFGGSTTTSFVDRSIDGGRSFVTMGLPGAGKYVGTGLGAACDGGGDSDLATDQFNDIYVNDLGEGTVAAAVSNDRGVTFTVNCIAGEQGGRPNYLPDRQWLATDTVHGREWFIYRDGLLNVSSPTDAIDGGIYGEYIEYAPLPTASGTAGLSQVTFQSLCTTNGLASPCNSDVQVAGNAVTDNSGFAGTPRAGTTYVAQRTPDGIGVMVINPALTPAFTERTAVKGVNAVLFPSVGVDRAGNVYLVYVDDQTFQVMFTWSGDQGLTWSKAAAVNASPARTAVMPWIVGGDAGRVDVVYYGSSLTSTPSSNVGPWNLYMLQSLDATAAAPQWSQQLATDRPNHLDPVCLSGLGCTTDTGTSGDRELGDFFRVLVDHDGRAMISFADGNNQLGAEDVRGTLPAPSFAHFVRQATGPSLDASVGSVPPIDVPTNSVSVAPYDDPVPPSTPTGPGATDAALELLGSSVDFPDASHLHIHLAVANLDTTAATTTTAGPVATYLTRWWYGGRLYAAGAEVNAAGQWSYFAGQPVPVDDGLAIKYAYYPATSTESGSVTTGARGTIDLTVALADVGSPTPSSTLYSVTSYALAHTAPTLPLPSGTTIQAVSDLPVVATALPAYNVMPLTSGGGTAGGTPTPGGTGTTTGTVPTPNTAAGRTGGLAPMAALLSLVGAGAARRRRRRSPR